MTETLTKAETPPSEIRALLASWVDNPPASLTSALAEQGLDVEALESYARSGISTDDAETLRKVLVQGAAGEDPADAALLARMTPLLDPRERAWDRLLRAKSTQEVITATVTEATKGGLVVNLGVRGFIPASQVGLSVPRNLSQYVGRTLKLRVLEVDRRRQTVILTNRQVMEEERADRRRQAINRITEGETRTGTVRRLTDIGAFVDVGGVDGLLHVSEISWKRIEKPSDVLKVGEKIEVKVLKVDPEAGRISLSTRRLAADPWEQARRKYAPGTTVTGTVTATNQGGAVVQLDEDLEGFLPISELANRRVSSPEEVVQVGQQVEVLVIDLVPRERRIVLSIRKLEHRRERQIVENYQRKSRSGSERTTLGDLFGDVLGQLRRELVSEDPEAAAEVADAEDSEAPAAAAVAADVAPADVVTETGEVEDTASEEVVVEDVAAESDEVVASADEDAAEAAETADEKPEA